ncbi:GCN5 family acetyltransferase [Clostridium sp. DMHC 10]|uniref:GNAT family N-acetyltransferase n=1 Tax=Clostridium sp. DMHC 10 TaxID=747377 RepID=UPI00069E1FE1|nr:GNAT family N-acetyltransferase [Clostridium sp. DMHC 10]KOF57516.1 GCN5 family acetyltransferase [Clostridium sp. DMHC 10]
MIFKSLETERLILKNIAVEDREFIFSQFSDPVVTKYLFDREPLTDIGGADEILELYLSQPEPHLHHRWILVRKTDGIKMGTCGIHRWDQKTGTAEVGYDLKEEFWGKGYMQEAIKEIIEFAIENMNIKAISACIYVDNEKSKHLAEKLGFVLSGSTYEAFRDKEYPHNVYTLYVGK